MYALLILLVIKVKPYTNIFLFYFQSADDQSCAIVGEVYDQFKGTCSCGTANSCAALGIGKGLKQ